MKPSFAAASAAWLFLTFPVPACGPFFPDTILTYPQAALKVPPVSYLHGLCQIAGRPLPAEGFSSGREETPLLGQIPSESAELRDEWRQAGVGGDEIDRRIRHYESVRLELLAPARFIGWDFPTLAENPPNLPERPLGGDFPPAVADYVEAARLHAFGKTAEARDLWKEILNRPAEEKKLRSVWSAWMLAKTSASRTEAMEWYARVETEAALGGKDVLRLRAAAQGWRAPRLENPIESVHWYFDAFAAGADSASIGLRNACGRIFTENRPEILAAAAADPLVRRLVNLDYHARLDISFTPTGDEALDARAGPTAEWLSAMEAHAPQPLEDGNRLAWALYSLGRYDEARKWMGLAAKDDPLGLWLQAKFDLRDGNLDLAARHLSGAVKGFSATPDWQPANPAMRDNMRWHADAENLSNTTQGRLLGESGVIALGRGEYLSALEMLRKGGYREDAAYLAECVISTDGLLKHVRAAAPRWIAEAEPERTPLDPSSVFTTRTELPPVAGTDNQLRYLLARRLAREHRLREAREFMPPDLLPLLDHYIALDRARRTGRFSGEARAAVVWRQALIHRHCGAELFSTEGMPDGGAVGWVFPATSFIRRRSFREGWSSLWDRDPQVGPWETPFEKAVPIVTADEIARTRRYALPADRRFHYRYAAADLAWEAAKALPANHPLLPRLYNTAGRWLADRDPAAADRFYQAMVRRCAKTPEGRAADEKRWFLPGLEPLGDLPSLPAIFKAKERVSGAP